MNFSNEAQAYMNYVRDPQNIGPTKPILGGLVGAGLGAGTGAGLAALYRKLSGNTLSPFATGMSILTPAALGSAIGLGVGARSNINQFKTTGDEIFDQLSPEEQYQLSLLLTGSDTPPHRYY